jgi:hypothetical protein
VIESFIVAVAIVYGVFLVWGGVTAIRVLGRLVLAPRPASFVYLRLTSIWSVGSCAVMIGLAIALHGLAFAAN